MGREKVSEVSSTPTVVDMKATSIKIESMEMDSYWMNMETLSWNTSKRTN